MQVLKNISRVHIVVSRYNYITEISFWHIFGPLQECKLDICVINKIAKVVTRMGLVNRYEARVTIQFPATVNRLTAYANQHI